MLSSLHLKASNHGNCQVYIRQQCKLPIYPLCTQGGADQAQNIESEVSATDVIQAQMISIIVLS